MEIVSQNYGFFFGTLTFSREKAMICFLLAGPPVQIIRRPAASLLHL